MLYHLKERRKKFQIYRCHLYCSINILLRQLFGFESRLILKIQNWRHRQRVWPTHSIPPKICTKKSFKKLTVIRLQRVGCLLCLRNLFCRIHPSFLEAMAWKIVFRHFFHKDNLQTELSCWIKYVQSHFQEFLEYEKVSWLFTGSEQKPIIVDEI